MHNQKFKLWIDISLKNERFAKNHSPLLVSPLVTLAEAASVAVSSDSLVWVAGIRNLSWLTGFPSAFSSLGSGGSLKKEKRINYFSLFQKTCFHFQNGFQNELSYSKCAFIFKMWMVLWVLFFLFPKNTIANKNLYILYQ